jgi:signal transduction histidine kinase/DNA-binding response OmpR family regulator
MPPVIVNATDVEPELDARGAPLREAGFEVLDARTGAGTLQLVAARHPDLVLLDVRLAGPGGFDVCRLIKADPATNDVIVLHVSATPMDPGARALGLDSGADGCLVEPIDARELVATVRARLRDREAVRRLKLEEARLEALLRLAQMSDASVAGMAAFVLEHGITLTESKIGFVGFLSEDEAVYALHAVSKDVVKECGVAGNPMEWPVGSAGIWADAIRRRKALFVQDYSQPHPSKKGLPAGHLPLQRFMVVPVCDGERIVMVAGVGNKASDYDKSDERQIALLLSGLWNAVQRHRARAALQHARDDLEQRVNQRTAELAASNADLQAEIAERERVEQALRESEAQLRRQAAELAEANRLKDDFLGTLSHDLRTPLNAILGWGAMLQEGGLDPATVRRAHLAIVRNAHAQRQLIDDTLDVSRIVTGTMKIDPEDVDIVLLLAGALETVRPAADAKGIVIDCHVDAALPLVFADAGRLRQVFWNLLSNAVKFTPRGGRVTVRAGRASSQLEVSVEDTGIGISPRFLPHVFERFSQADSSASRAHGGLGLGLAIARHLVELHGGTIRADSAGEGQGAIFTIGLPVRALAELHRRPDPDSERAGPPSVRAMADMSLAGVHVLVIDDDGDARAMLAACLRRAGATVTVAASAAEGVETLRRLRPDVLVADLGMPGEDGYQFVRQVRSLPFEEGGATAAVALTAYARADDRRRALAAGYQEFLTKPASPDVVVSVVAGLVQGPAEGHP